MRNEIRYFSVSFGESSHRPAPPDLTIQRRFGDCKDKSLLLVSLLRKLGINADPVLVAVRRKNNLEALLPSPTIFDHAIVRVRYNGNEYFLDPTRVVQDKRLETTGQPLTGSEVLIVDPQTKAFSTIAPFPVGLPTNTMAETLVITDFSKPAALESRFTAYGMQAEEIRAVRQRFPREYDKLLLDDMTHRYSSAHRVGDVEVHDSLDDNRLEIIEHYTLDKPAEFDHGVWYVRFSPANIFSAIRRPESLDRRTPLLIAARPYSAKYAFQVTLPDDISMMRDPRNKEIRNDFFRLGIAETFRGNVSRIELDLHTLAESVPPSSLRDLAKDIHTAGMEARGYVAIPASAVKKRSLFESSDHAFARKIRNDLEQEVASFTKVIKSGKLSGKDLAMVYRERGISYSNLEQLDAALADLQESIRLDTPNPAPRIDAGIVQTKRGNYQAALSQLNQALALGAEPASVYASRGHAYYYMNRYEDALHDFEKIALASEPSDSKTFVTIWYLLALGHTGKPLVQDVKDRLDKEAQGSWPRPVFGLFTGASTPDTVLAVVDQMQGDERLMAQCEAYFYIGQYYLLRNDLVKAREFFEKAKATKVLMYTEYMMAGMELDRLTKQQAAR